MFKEITKCMDTSTINIVNKFCVKYQDELTKSEKLYLKYFDYKGIQFQDFQRSTSQNQYVRN